MYNARRILLLLYIILLSKNLDAFWPFTKKNKHNKTTVNNKSYLGKKNIRLNNQKYEDDFVYENDNQENIDESKNEEEDIFYNKINKKKPIPNDLKGTRLKKSSSNKSTKKTSSINKKTKKSFQQNSKFNNVDGEFYTFLSPSWNIGLFSNSLNFKVLDIAKSNVSKSREFSYTNEFVIGSKNYSIGIGGGYNFNNFVAFELEINHAALNYLPKTEVLGYKKGFYYSVLSLLPKIIYEIGIYKDINSYFSFGIGLSRYHLSIADFNSKNSAIVNFASGNKSHGISFKFFYPISIGIGAYYEDKFTGIIGCIEYKININTKIDLVKAFGDADITKHVITDYSFVPASSGISIKLIMPIDFILG